MLIIERFTVKMEKLFIKRICPLPAELSEIKKNIPCSEEGCNRMFLNSSNLDMHLLKHHKKSNKIVKISSDVKYQYHCPIDNCSYNLKSERFFKNMKYLKQHFLKVHAEKNFCCDQCHKGFSTEAAQKKHERLCGVKFVCSCNYSYDSYEALITHAKRHQHSFDEKYKSFGKEMIPVIGSEDTGTNTSCSLHDVHSTSPTAIAVPVHLLAAVALNELSNKSFGTSSDKGVQTDSKNGDNKRQRKGPSPCRAVERSFKRRTSTHTQTGQVSRAKHPKISTQTQTMGDYILKKAMHAADILVIQNEELGVGKDDATENNRKRRKSMETQTTNTTTSICGNSEIINLGAKFSHTLDPNMNLSSLSNFPSTSYSHLNSNSNLYQLETDVLPDLWLSQKNSSGTQTSPVALSSLFEHDEMLNHTVTQTDLNLTLFDSESCEPNVSQSNTQQISNLQNYFEDSSDGNFNTNVISASFGQELTNSTIDHLTSLSDEADYSSAQLGNLLGSGRKVEFDGSRSCSTETQTEIDVNCFLPDCDNDTSFTLCSNIETQTTEELASLDHLLYSNMCTQTCDEILFSELGFADIETQTAWPQYTDDSALVSTETQTSLSASSGYQNSDKSWLMAAKDSLTCTSHMETQTNINDFQKIIAELVKEDTNDNLL